MAGKIKQMIDTIMRERTGNQKIMANVIRTKIILKGILPENFTADSEDDPVIINKLQTLFNKF